MISPPMHLIERWLARVVKTPDGCWMWPGATSVSGYAHVNWVDNDGRCDARLHRILYEHFVGPIPEGLCIDHLCRVRRCVNPAHLEPVTQAENIRRSPLVGGLRDNGPAWLNHSKTECAEGHPFDAQNTYIWKGKRYCRECQRAHKRDARRKATA